MSKLLSAIAIITLLSTLSCATQETTETKATLANIDTTALAPEKTGPLSSTINAYYKLKEAFVKTDGTTADMAAMQLRLSVDSLSTQNLHIDTTYTGAVAGYKKSMLVAVDSLIKQRDMQQKRRQFQVLSDSLYSLVKAFPYQGKTIYQVHCPMAFKNTGANWLNDQPIINNPYFGDKMLECGEVVDSVMEK